MIMAAVGDVLRMNSSQEGEMSYANNSSMQRAIASVTKKARQEMAAALYRARGRPASMAIADLGCGTGPNALLMVQDAVEAVLLAAESSGKNLPELQVLLNDLPGNDFNAVFRLLPTSKLAATGRRCFVSAWPGSFYGRIFPEDSIDYAVSSCSLHFLSKPPAAELVVGSNSNKRGRVYISSSSSSSTSSEQQQQEEEAEVLHAYAAQFHSDFFAFLRCRSPEMRPGGLVLATFVARRTACPTPHDCYLWDLIADALMDMAAAGIVDEERVHAFNAPYYSPSCDDILKAIHEEGSFTVRTLEFFDITRRRNNLIRPHRHRHGQDDEEEKERDADDSDSDSQEQQRLAVETANTVRAVVEPMMRAHFGWGGAMEMDALFSRYRLLLHAYYRAKPTHNKDDVTNVFLVLQKNKTQ